MEVTNCGWSAKKVHSFRVKGWHNGNCYVKSMVGEGGEESCGLLTICIDSPKEKSGRVLSLFILVL